MLQSTLQANVRISFLKIQFQICCKLYLGKENSQMYFANNFIKVHLNRIINSLSSLPRLD